MYCSHCSREVVAHKPSRVVEERVGTITPDTDVMEALRLLTTEHRQPMLLVVASNGDVKGIVTKTDILQVLKDYGTTTGEPENGHALGSKNLKEHSSELN